MFLTFLTIRTAPTTLTIRVGNVKVGCMEVSIRFMHPTTIIIFNTMDMKKIENLTLCIPCILFFAWYISIPLVSPEYFNDTPKYF